MPQRFLQISIASALAAGLGLIQPAQARQDCPGYQVYRNRSDHEAPVLPRTSIAAIAIQSPDGCDRSSEEHLNPQPSHPTEPARQSQQSDPTNETMPTRERPAER